MYKSIKVTKEVWHRLKTLSLSQEKSILKIIEELLNEKK